MAKDTAKKAATKKVATKKVAVPAAEKPAAKKAAVKKTAVAKPAAPAAVVAPAKAPRFSAASTTIVVQFDAGFGNNLYLRGSGPGLSWESGVLMVNTAANEWTWSTEMASSEFDFKVLLNDQVWSADPNYTALPGLRTIIQPDFV